jgi:TRAP-type C4-dicarboxylate transport system substrate-binding protein
MERHAGLRRALLLLTALALAISACSGSSGTADDQTGSENAADATSEESEGGDAAAADFSDAPAVEVVFGHPFPDQHHLVVNVLQPWMDDVTEQTEGTVTFNVQPGGALSGPQDAYEHPAAGVTDMGWALHGYTPGQFPLTEVFELPFLFDSAVQGTETLWDLYDEFDALQEEYSDTHVLALWTHDVGDLFTTRQPIRSASDLAGLSIRTPAPMQNNLIEALGGSAVGMPAPELYDSLDRGVIDGLMIGHSGVPTFNLQEVLGTVTRGNFFVGTMFLVMNSETWESMSPAQQAVFDETANRALSVALAEDMDRVGAEAADQFDDWGFEITELDDAALEEWRAATEQVPQQWIDAQAEGVPAQEMFDRVSEAAAG